MHPFGYIHCCPRNKDYPRPHWKKRTIYSLLCSTKLYYNIKLTNKTVSPKNVRRIVLKKRVCYFTLLIWADRKHEHIGDVTLMY